jgi:Family of unknown function (DUF6932)
MPIPAFSEDGYLPEGLHEASEDEVIARFGVSTPRREYLTGRLRRWLELARAVGAHRFFVNGSFVTDKAEPGDIDAVVWLPDDWAEQLRTGRAEALVLWEMLRTRQPEELFSARRAGQWQAWVDFFASTRQSARRKGVVEIWL